MTCAIRDIFLHFLAPQHANEWEYALHKCFPAMESSLLNTKTSLKKDNRISTKYDEVIRRIARLYITMKEDNAPREHLLEVCNLVTTTTSIEAFNDILKEEADLRHEQNIAELLRSSGTATATSTSHSSSHSSSNAPLTVSIPATATAMISTIATVALASPPLPLPSPQNATASTGKIISTSFYQLARLSDVSSKASAVRLRLLESEKRVKAYEADPAVATAIRLVEDDEGAPLVSAQRGLKKSSSVSSIDDRVVKCRLGYRSAKIFCEKLDIMQKIIKAYRESTDEGIKEFLLRLVCGSFTREEVNKYVLPPEAHILKPGKVRNMELISMHRWTEIRKAVGCPRVRPTLNPEIYAEGVRKRKRKKLEKTGQVGTGSGSPQVRSYDDNSIPHRMGYGDSSFSQQLQQQRQQHHGGFISSIAQQHQGSYVGSIPQHQHGTYGSNSLLQQIGYGRGSIPQQHSGGYIGSSVPQQQGGYVNSSVSQQGGYSGSSVPQLQGSYGNEQQQESYGGSNIPQQHQRDYGGSNASQLQQQQQQQHGRYLGSNNMSQHQHGSYGGSNTSLYQQHQGGYGSSSVPQLQQSYSGNNATQQQGVYSGNNIPQQQGGSSVPHQQQQHYGGSNIPQRHEGGHGGGAVPQQQQGGQGGSDGPGPQHGAYTLENVSVPQQQSQSQQQPENDTESSNKSDNSGVEGAGDVGQSK